MVRFQYVEALGRTLRVDDLETLGIPSQTLAEEALARGEWDEGSALANYFYEEMRIMHEILGIWVRDLLRQILARAGLSEEVARRTAAAMTRTLDRYSVGEGALGRCRAAIGAHDAVAAAHWLERVQLAFKELHDLLVAWIQDLLSHIAASWGEEAVLASILETHESIWGERYKAWDRLTAHEKLALTVEGMRGGHFSGTSRRGDILLVDEGDRYKMVMDPCGSGGVLRRGDPETGRGPYPISEHGTNRQPHLWTWQKTGVHWYCTHCCIAMEWLPGRKRGRPLRPLDHILDPQKPCTWYVYKDEAKTRAYHFPRTGLEVPGDAPELGEDWRAEYPGGS